MRKALGILACMLIAVTLACTTEQPAIEQEEAAPGSDSAAVEPVIVDHVIVGISDLDEGIEQLEALTGVRAFVGGEHPGRGTRNALISLGPGHYLELLAPVPGGVIDELDDLAGSLDEFSELAPIGWAASSQGMDGLAAKLVAVGYEVEGPEAGSRVKPDGSVLEWRTLAITQPMIATAPFFIQWSESSVHPSQSSPVGCELGAVRIQDPDAAALGDLVNLVGLDVEVEQGESPAFDFVLECPNGTVHLSGTGMEQ
jgi:hypothetical protein